MSRSSHRSILLVDGYNAIGLWPRLRDSHALQGLETARRDLIEALVNYSAVEALDSHVVFDSQYQYTPRIKEMVTDNLSVCYTDFGQTADAYIEKTCASLRQQLRLFKQRLIVATSDRVLQQTAIGYGAEWMSVEQLTHEVESAANRCRHRSKSRKQNSRRLLANFLDPESQKRLAQLRMGGK